MLELILVTVLIMFLSFLSSSMEAALFTVTFVQVEHLVERKRPGALRLKMNKDRIQDSIIAIVILNNLANITGSVLVGSIAAGVFNDLVLGIFSGVLTFLIILFGEVIPKTIGERYAESYALRSAGIVYLLRVLLRPFIAVTRFLVKPISKGAPAATRTSEEHIKTLARLGYKFGTILESENQLIKRVFHLNDILARDIMTPRTVVEAFHADDTLGELEADLYKSPFSRFPVYVEDHDDIIGVVHIRDLLTALGKGKREKTIRDFTEDVRFIPDTAKADQLLRTFQKNREHFAIVIDEYGGTAGVLTLEDILEQLVGEIVDEFDSDVDLRVKARALKERKEGDYEKEV